MANELTDIDKETIGNHRHLFIELRPEKVEKSPAVKLCSHDLWTSLLQRNSSMKQQHRSTIHGADAVSLYSKYSVVIGPFYEDGTDFFNHICSSGWPTDYLTQRLYHVK